MLPTSPRCLSDIWRSFWAQRLLWELGGNLGISTASAFTTEPSASTECQPHMDAAAELVQDLVSLQWTSTTLPGRMLEAAAVMAAKGRIQLSIVHLMQAWISDLTKVGYSFPALGQRQQTGKIKTAAAAGSTTLSPQTITNASLHHTFVFPRHWCMHLDKAVYVNFNKLGQYNSVQQIKLLHAAYRPLFRKVVFAGVFGNNPLPEIKEHQAQGRMFDCDPYVKGFRSEVGFMGYVCAAGALEADTWTAGLQQTPGMLYINDDVVISPCMLSRFNSSNMWYSSRLNATRPASTRQGWHWQTRFSALNYTLSEALQQAMQQAFGLMAQRKAAYLKNDTDAWHFNQADMFYLPARLQKEYIAMAQQMRVLYVISEAAVPNILGLLRSQPADVEPFSFAWPWNAERVCLDNAHRLVMPLQHNLNATAIHACTKEYVYAEEQSDKDGFFALHPVKLSNATFAQHWLNWWSSQSC